jgi:hypothetical protein
VKGALAGAALMAMVFGCAGGLDQTGTGGTGGGTGGAPPCVPQGGTTTPPATFATVQEAMMGFGAVESCWSNPCHAKFGMVPPTMPLVLAPEPDVYTRMMSYYSHACGMPLVTPGKPAESALVKIITGPCGALPQMPYQCTGEQCLPPEYIAAITQWVANCAPP